MNIPGFTGEASLFPAIGIYRWNVLSDGRHNSGRVVPTQIGYPWTPIPPYSPIGGWPVTPPPPPPPGWTYPPGWTPPYPGWTPPPGWPPPPVPVLGGAGAAAGGISLWWLIPGVIVGVALGAAVGFGTEYILTPEEPTPGPTLGCTRIGPRTLRKYTGSYWGCRRSYAKTLNDIENRCSSLRGQCAGICPSGAPCTPTAIVHDIGQIPGYLSCDTWVWYECGCGC